MQNLQPPPETCTLGHRRKLIQGNCLARSSLPPNQPRAVLEEAPGYWVLATMNCKKQVLWQQPTLQDRDTAGWECCRMGALQDGVTPGWEQWWSHVCYMTQMLKSFACRSLPAEPLGTRKENPFLQCVYNAFYSQSLTPCLLSKKKFLKNPYIFTKSRQWRLSLEQRSNTLNSWHIIEHIYSFFCWWEFGMFSVFCS